MGGRGGRARGPGPRSFEGLRWLGRVDVAGLEPLGLVLGTGRSTTYSHVARLVAAGLVVRLDGHEGSVVAITREGRRFIGDRPAGGGGALPLAGRAHWRAVSWVAALVALRGRDWVSDREARSRGEWRVPVAWSGGRTLHRPDVGVVVAGRRVAVEVELSHKAPGRLRAILAGYEAEVSAGRLGGGVLYVSDRPDVLVAVELAARRVGLPPGSLRTRPLAAVQDEARRVAAEKRTDARDSV